MSPFSWRGFIFVLNPESKNREFAFRYTVIRRTSTSTGQTHAPSYHCRLSYDSLQFGRHANISEDPLFAACYKTSKMEAAVYSEEMLCIQQSTRRHVKVIRNLETSVRTASLMCLVLDKDNKLWLCETQRPANASTQRGELTAAY